MKDIDVMIFTCHDDDTDYSEVVADGIGRHDIYMPYEENKDKFFNIIGYKRQQMLTYAYEQGYTYCVMIDDDTNPITKKITPESKRTTSNSYAHVKTNIVETIKRLIEVADEYHASYAGCPSIMYLSFSQPNLVKVNERVNAQQFYMFNVKDVCSHNITYSYNEELNEDIDIALKILQHGLTCVTVMDHGFAINNKDSTLFEDVKKREPWHIGIFKKWHTTLYLDRHGVIRTKMKWIKYFNTFELPELNKFQQRVLEIIENNEPYEVLYNTLNNKKI